MPAAAITTAIVILKILSVLPTLGFIKNNLITQKLENYYTVLMMSIKQNYDVHHVAARPMISQYQQNVLLI